jgi:hypothetical protein
MCWWGGGGSGGGGSSGGGDQHKNAVGPEPLKKWKRRMHCSLLAKQNRQVVAETAVS